MSGNAVLRENVRKPSRRPPCTGDRFTTSITSRSRRHTCRMPCSSPAGAYTAVYAPAGLEQGIRHVWRRDREVIDVVNLSPVHGGRREGFRTFSRKTAFPDIVIGRWSVDVVTDSGQLIGRLRFRVIP